MKSPFLRDLSASMSLTLSSNDKKSFDLGFGLSLSIPERSQSLFEGSNLSSSDLRQFRQGAQKAVRSVSNAAKAERKLRRYGK